MSPLKQLRCLSVGHFRSQEPLTADLSSIDAELGTFSVAQEVLTDAAKVSPLYKPVRNSVHS